MMWFWYSVLSSAASDESYTDLLFTISGRHRTTDRTQNLESWLLSFLLQLNQCVPLLATCLWCQLFDKKHKFAQNKFTYYGGAKRKENFRNILQFCASVHWNYIKFRDKAVLVPKYCSNHCFHFCAGTVFEKAQFWFWSPHDPTHKQVNFAPEVDFSAWSCVVSTLMCPFYSVQQNRKKFLQPPSPTWHYILFCSSWMTVFSQKCQRQK